MRSWDGEVVAYNDETGHTHHFMELAAWVFAQLQGHPMTEDDLVTVAASELELQADGNLGSSISSSLALFRRLGLIEESPP